MKMLAPSCSLSWTRLRSQTPREQVRKKMEIPEIAEFARNFSVMVRIQGPDPKGLKMRKHAFHLHQSGATTLSASGLLIPPGSLSNLPQFFEHIASIHCHSGALVITMASVIEPFLTTQHRDNPTKETFPKLIPDASIDVLVEGRSEGSNRDNPGTSPHWVPSHLLALVDVPASSDVLMSLIGAQGGPYEQASWELGWSLAPHNNDHRTGGSGSYRQVENDFRFSDEAYKKLSLDESNNATVMAHASTRIAFLGVSALDLKDVLNMGISHPRRRGDFLLLMGSPFGVLSPLHFYNSISVGTVANCFPVGSSHSSLLMADIHCLPGMEGAPVFDKQGLLIGILTRPLRTKGGIAEIQLVISWDAIAAAGSDELRKEAQRAQKELIDRNINRVQKSLLYGSNHFRRSGNDLPGCPDFPCTSLSSLEKAISSIALVTVGDGAWASGIVLNNHGLVLTNAHILEPWRFGRTSLLGLMNKNTTSSFEHGRNISLQEESIDKEGRWALFPSRLGSSEESATSGHEGSFLSSYYRNYKRISIRLHHMGQHTWYGATVVYVSKGPWDVALLQIESVPDQLCPITPEFAHPVIGSTIHVIGHGLIGPRSDLSPSVSSGVLANVVRIPGLTHLPESSIVDTEKRNAPIMLQTTAAVHPGASGGAVVNSDGHLIGLVTSNARHGGGTIIPHLNFSIPCSALEPIFKFSGKQDIAALQVLDYPNELLSSVWALIPPPSTMLRTSPENREVKGSRFSQFLAERRVGISQKDQIIGKIRSKI